MAIKAMKVPRDRFKALVTGTCCMVIFVVVAFCAVYCSRTYAASEKANDATSTWNASVLFGNGIPSSEIGGMQVVGPHGAKEGEKILLQATNSSDIDQFRLFLRNHSIATNNAPVEARSIDLDKPDKTYDIVFKWKSGVRGGGWIYVYDVGGKEYAFVKADDETGAYRYESGILNYFELSHRYEELLKSFWMFQSEDLLRKAFMAAEADLSLNPSQKELALIQILAAGRSSFDLKFDPNDRSHLYPELSPQQAIQWQPVNWKDPANARYEEALKAYEREMRLWQTYTSMVKFTGMYLEKQNTFISDEQIRNLVDQVVATPEVKKVVQESLIEWVKAN